MFPYLSILKKAYAFTIRHPWLWLFGLLLGGFLIANFGNMQSVPRVETVARVMIADYPMILQRVAAHPAKFALAVFGLAAGGVLLLLVGALAKAAVVLAAVALTDKDRQKDHPEIQPNIRSIIAASVRYVRPIVKLNILAAALMVLLLSVFLVPIGYLLELGAASRAFILAIFGGLVFFPGLIVFWYVRIYGPIFIVWTNSPVSQAIQLSFGLLHAKLKESLIFGMIVGVLTIMFIFLASFSIILFSIPQIAATTFLGNSGSYWVLEVLLASSFLLLSGFITVLASAFAVFATCAWVFAVQHMVKTRKLEAEKEALAIEPEPAA